MLKFAAEVPENWEQPKADVIMICPTPMVWSSHIYIATDEAGTAGIDALLDDQVQQLAWEKHGFRTEVSGTESGAAHFQVPHLAGEITQVVSMPNYATMEKIIAALT